MVFITIYLDKMIIYIYIYIYIYKIYNIYNIYLLFNFSKPRNVLEPPGSFCTSWRAWALASVPRCLASVPQSLAWDALGTLLDALGRNLALPIGLQARLARHLALQTGLQVQFGLDFELFWVPPRVVFHAVVTLLPLPALTFSKKTRPMKNLGKT